MEVLSKDDLQYKIKDKDYEIVKDHLIEVEKRSYGSFRNRKGVVLECLNFLNKELKEISMLEIKTYFETILDKKNVKLTTKRSYRSNLRSFFDYVQGVFLAQNIDFRNPVPQDRVFKFTQKEFDIKKQSDVEDEIFTDLELLEILEFAKKRNFRDFILFSLLIITGARVSEILSIKVKDINLEKRFFETGFVKGARKTSLSSKKSLLFFFPENFSKYLGTYLNYLDNGEVWLFPGRSKHYHYNSFHRYVKSNYGQNFSNFHKFRKSLITNRVKIGCPLWASEGLMNHKSSSVEGEFYIKLSIEEKLNLFDEYFPYSFIPYF